MNNLDQQKLTSLSCSISPTGQQKFCLPDSGTQADGTAPDSGEGRGCGGQELEDYLAPGPKCCRQEQLILAFRWLQLVMWLHSAEKGPRSTILPCAQRGCSEIFENRIDDNHRAHMSVLEKIQHGLVLW